MRTLFLSLLAVGCSRPGPVQVPVPVPEPAAVVAHPTYDAAQFFETTSAWGGTFNHDGSRLLITSDASGVFNAVSVAADGSGEQALTASTTDSRFGVSWFPADDRFLFAGDTAGNERSHLFVMELDGTSVDLTPGDETRARFRGWNGDRTAFYLTSNERDPKADDVYVVTLDEGYPRTLLFENTASWQVGPVGPRGRYVGLSRPNSNVDSDLYLWDAEAGGEPAHLTPHEGEITYGFDVFEPDGSGVWYTSDAGGEFAAAWRYDLATGAHDKRIEEPWDVRYVAFSDGGRYRVHGVNADARTVVKVVDTQTGEAVPMPAGLPDGDVTDVEFSRDEATMRLWVSSDTAPSNLYVVDVGGGEARRLTDTLNPAIDEGALVVSEVVRFESFDGLEIPALLYRPKTASAEAPVPAVLWIHGGPGGQSRTGYSATLQHLVNHGYAVLAVNNRGSSGYGRTFFHADDRQHGDVDLKDCIWGRRYLEGLDWVDGERVGIMGGSYGGYMVLAALAFEPDAFEVGVDIFGVSNWIRTLESIPPWWASFRTYLVAEIGDPETDRERLEAHSPLLHADRITKPLLVVQGANDPRVLQVESDEIVAAVRAKGVPVEYVLFDDEGHGFMKRDNRIEASEAYLSFLDAHLAR